MAHSKHIIELPRLLERESGGWGTSESSSEGDVGQHRDLGPENLLCSSGLQASLLPWIVNCPLILKSMGMLLKVCSFTDRLCGDGNGKRTGLCPDNSLCLHSMLF